MAYYPTTMDLPSHCALVRRVTITPTRIYFNTPTVETTNRVVRHFRHVQENFIRAQFTDELLEGRITGSEADRDDQIYTRAFRVLDYGIRIGQWHWKFLAFGNSQIRENGAFFFCEPEGRPEDVVTCEKIRKWMGRFNHIKVVAKYAARLGQCFSTTRLVPGISAPRIVKIPDVEKGKYCFTDGVGKISALLAGMVAQDWKIYPPPSAYQFRMGGCKGVLVTSPDAKGTEVHIRKSQEKFFAEFNGLEVIRCSRFSCATLNRQTITILSSLGVPDSVFVGLMAEQLSNYNDAMTNKSRAVQLLSRYVDENQTTLSIARMVLDGFMETRDPFVQTLLQLWRSWSIKSLKEKARLIVDEGAFVLGCVDETGTLRGHSKAIEGRRKVERDELPQIFIQVPNPDERGAYKVITGLCLVGRNPSLHPGDIRVVEAIDVPGLRHIRDVVVFPLKGDRDVPSMCSGGDLDGDDFFVIWDQKMIPSERCHPPMDYTPPAPIQELVGPSADSLKAFFVLFMKNNTLPLIAHAHLATADREPDGPKNDRCIKLAQLHSMAVDYVKTGVPAEWSKRLDPRKWPHFMEKNRKGTYHSSMALGQLYDMVKKEMFDSKESYKLPFDSRVLKKYNLDNDILKKARQIKSKYDIGMRRTMGQLEIKTEFEVWTTFVLSKPRVGSSYKMQEDVGRESAALKQQYREMCIKAAGGSRDFEKMAPFVAAMYRVTSEEVRIALYEARQQHVRPDGTVGLRKISARSMPLISFPWLFESYLGRIATGSDTESKLADLVPSIPTKPKSHGLISQSILEMEPDEAYTRTSDGQIIHRGEILHLFNHEDDDDEVDYDPDERPTSESPAKSDMEGIWDTQNKPGASDETSLPDKEAGIDRAIPPKETLGEASNLHEDGFVIDNPAQQPAGDRAETFPQTPVLRPTANTDEEEQADLLDLTPSVSASKRSKSMTESSVGFADASVGWSPVKTIYQESKTEDTTRELDDKEISFVDETEASSLTNGNSPYITDARTGSSGEPIIPTDDEAETEAYEAVIESVIANPQEHPVLDSRGKGTEVMASVNGSVDLLGIDDRFTDKAGKSRPKSPYHEDLMALSQQPGSRNGPFTAESRTELDNTKVAVNGFMLQEEHILHSRPQSEPGNGDVAGAAFNSDRLIAISPVKLQAPVRAPMQALSVYTLSRRLAAITGTGGHNQSASTGFDLPSQDVPETATGTDTGTKGSNYDSEDDSRDHGLAAITMATDDGDIYSPCASEKEDAADDGSDLGSELEYEEEVVVIEDETALERTLKLLAS
ncbi:RNA dependent RNA polymerase-domain-containing protein [Bombardia bombarda]|uniref:RNA-dependent RNA polymerase n=1 Tax=Bombardia bombarda TaxID=252184 RepID=A0AA39X7F6_9PEZI|nr:RNA dependent RNA polymerase-domain-containing protein [Bombardia bombarda]